MNDVFSTHTPVAVSALADISYLMGSCARKEMHFSASVE
jgi:hypothetical protein